jgi:hypothetical protein
MDRRTWFCFLCLLLIAPAAHAVCHWDPDTTPQPGIRECEGSHEDYDPEWPRLPTDAEIESAKEDFLAELTGGETRTRIDDVKVVTFHTCSGNWTNQVEMRVGFTTWWESITGEGKWVQGSSETFLVYTPGSKSFEFVSTHVPSAYFSGMYGEPPLGFARGACAAAPGTVSTAPGGPTPAPPDDGGEIPWVVVVGALAVLGAAGLAGAKVLGGKGKKGDGDKKNEREEKEEEKVTYILQLSSDRLAVGPEQPAPLTVTVWKRIGDGAPRPAPGASITITAPPASGVQVAPPGGTSPLSTMVSAEGAVPAAPITLEVVASVGETSTRATVTVEVTGEADMEFY